MCDATRMAVSAELFPEVPFMEPPPCDACPWPLGHVLCFSPETGCFVLCRDCAERLHLQTLVACLLSAALSRSVRLI
jgi:hypothetical protein